MAMNLPTFIPLEEAARRYGLSREVLTRLVEDGKIRAARVNGGIAVAKEDVSSVAIQLSADLNLDKSLRGQPIRVTEAAERYGVSQANLSRWADAGYIQIIDRRRRLLLLDEADVKLAAEIFKRACEETGSFVRAGWVLKRSLEQSEAA